MILFNPFDALAPSAATTAAELAQLYGARQHDLSDDAVDRGSKVVARYSHPARRDHFERIGALISVSGYTEAEQRFVRTCCGLSARRMAPEEQLRQSDHHLLQEAGARLRRVARAEVETSLRLARQHLAQCPNDNEKRSHSLSWSHKALAQARIAFEPNSAQLQRVQQEIAALKRTEQVEMATEAGATLPTIKPLPPGQAQAQLDALVGLEAVKEEVKNLVAFARLARLEAAGGTETAQRLNLHAFFGGKPGTGKTKVAQIYGSLLHDAGILPSGHVVVADKSALVGKWQGHTPEKAQNVIKEALGGVLFIDEAHTFASHDDDLYAKEAISQLVTAMLEHQGKFAVVFATYSNKRDALFAVDAGLKRRLPTQLEFPDYDDGQLATILVRMATGKGFTVADTVAQAAAEKVGERRHAPDFGNAGAMESALDAALKKRARRLMQDDGTALAAADAQDRTLVAGDFSGVHLLSGDHFSARDKHQALPPGAAQAQLEGMVGLKAIKQEIKDLVAVSRLMARPGHRNAGLSLNAFFGGNPGTGKTETARIYGSLLRDAGVLKRGHVIAISGTDLGLGGGQKAQELVERALGGVLFIDEAHLLWGQQGRAAAQEAISNIMVAMLKHKGELAVIFATYPQFEEPLLALDSGLRRRIGNFLHFPDYADDELAEILAGMAHQRGFTVAPTIARTVGAVLGRSRGAHHFGNAGDVETCLDQAVKRWARRWAEAAPDAGPAAGDRTFELTDFTASSVNRSDAASEPPAHQAPRLF